MKRRKNSSPRAYTICSSSSVVSDEDGGLCPEVLTDYFIQRLGVDACRGISKLGCNTFFISFV
jgi:hypothetical protein